MPDDRLPQGGAARPPADETTHSVTPTANGGFLTDAGDPAADWPDGDFLAQRSVAPSTPRPPSAVPPRATPPGPPGWGGGNASGDDELPATTIETSVALRFGGLVALALGLIILYDTRELPVPLVLIVAGLLLIFYFGSPTRLLREQIIDRWDVLVDGAQGRGADIMTTVTQSIGQQALPAVAHAEQAFAASLVRGGTRPFLVISQDANGRLRHYKMYVNVRDYGTNLQTSWFLIYHRGFFEKLKPNPLVALNLFDEQDLRAYVTAVHHAFLDSVVELMLSLGQDTSKLDRKTNGFLGIS